jgi:putative membrane protein
MKRTIQGVILATSLLTGGLSLAQSAAGGAAPASPPGQTKAAKPQKGMAEFQGFMAPTDEKAMLERLHYDNQKEIKQGQLATQNAQSPDVKAFGSMMVKDHTALDQKLMSYAQSKGMKLGDNPKGMNDMEKKMMAQDKATMEQLQVLTGSAFDSSYMAGQVEDHDATLGKVMAARQAMTNMDPQMSAMMQELMQRVPAHREQALSILGKLSATMGVGGSGGAMGGKTGGTMGGGTGGTTGGSMDHGSMGHGTTGGTTGGTTAPTTPAPKK